MEKILAKEQAGFRAERSTTGQIFNLQNLCKKHLQNQEDLHHVFKKAFERVWHAALWVIKYIGANLVRVIEQLYDEASSIALNNVNVGEWFPITVGVRQGCLLSPTLFNFVLKRLMKDVLEQHAGTISTGGKMITKI